jgi:hypothetical protein
VAEGIDAGHIKKMWIGQERLRGRASSELESQPALLTASASEREHPGPSRSPNFKKRTRDLTTLHLDESRLLEVDLRLPDDTRHPAVFHLESGHSGLGLYSA